jgi:hypothetical protein
MDFEGGEEERSQSQGEREWGKWKLVRKGDKLEGGVRGEVKEGKKERKKVVEG